MKRLLCISLLVFLMACSSEKPSGTAGQGSAGEGTGREGKVPQGTLPPGSSGSTLYSLEITPANARRNSVLYLSPRGFNLQDTKIEWLVNGMPVKSPQPGQFTAAGTKKGDSIQAKTILQNKEIASNIVQIRNSPPALSEVRFLPEVFKQGDTLSVGMSATDTDGDGVTFTCEWTRNGEPAGSGTHLAGPLKRGDKITVKITPFDGEAYGTAKTLVKEIANMPPMITDDRKFNFDGSVWTSQIKASDPDGDALTYTLREAPQGMTIAQNGLITWRVPADFKGKVPATVSVTDGHGGEAVYILAVVITEDSAVKRPR